MLKKVILGGIAASAIGFHLIENKKTKENIKKYCPAFIKCCKDNNNLKKNKKN